MRLRCGGERESKARHMHMVVRCWGLFAGVFKKWYILHSSLLCFPSLTFMHVPLSVAVVTWSRPSASSREGEREQGKAYGCVCVVNNAFSQESS